MNYGVRILQSDIWKEHKQKIYFSIIEVQGLVNIIKEKTIISLIQMLMVKLHK